jgi:bifunctional non-homologous end joining protein LigD
MDYNVKVEGRTLHLTNLDKILFPETGFTKAHVMDYYQRVASALLPHLRNRPLTLKRYPDGIDRGYFYEKDCPERPA